MKLLKFIPLLLVLALFNSNAFAAKDCDEIKGNVIGKLFCKATFLGLVFQKLQTQPKKKVLAGKYGKSLSG